VHRFAALIIAPAVAIMPAQAQTASELRISGTPIALYPDPLLAQILMAATYPLEVVEADRCCIV
jgi:hypothetical protein